MPGRSPPLSLVCGPTTPECPSVSAPVPLAFDLPRCECLVLLRLPHALAYAEPSEIGARLPWAASYEETLGPPRLLGRPLRTCHDRPPRRPGRPHLPLCRRRPYCLQDLRYLGLMPELPLSLAAYHGPHVRLTTHQRRRYQRRCKSSYQPAGHSFDWAGFAPAGRLFQNFKAASSTSYSSQTSSARSHPQAGISLEFLGDSHLRGNDNFSTQWLISSSDIFSRQPRMQESIYSSVEIPACAGTTVFQ